MQIYHSKVVSPSTRSPPIILSVFASHRTSLRTFPNIASRCFSFALAKIDRTAFSISLLRIRGPHILSRYASTRRTCSRLSWFGRLIMAAIALGGSNVTWPRYKVRRVGITGRRGVLDTRGPWIPSSSEGNDRFVSVMCSMAVHVRMAQNKWSVAEGTICT